MCIPQRPSQAPISDAQSSIPAATSLQIGGMGAPRGAAQLGRLALRFGAASSSAASATSSATAQQTAAALATPAAAPAPGNAATSAQVAGVGTAPGSLAGLRFGNFNQAYS